MDNPHQGHRERVRKQFLSNGFAGMPQHQILELLLFYAIPRVDTNELAHRMISRFGSVRGVLDADINELISVNGIGMKGAVFLKMLPQLFEVYMSSRFEGEKLCDMSTISSFVSNMYYKVNTEVLRLICLDDSYRVRDNVIISNGDNERVTIKQRVIMQKVLNSGCSNCILVHNHPYSSSKPSNADILSTKKLIDFLESAGITLIDHVVVGEDGVSSIIHGGYL